MIYVTVGTQLKFDRLIDIVNDWNSNGREEIFAQVGPSDKAFSNLSAFNYASPGESNDYFRQSKFIIAHAGMGSILTARQYGKPIIIFPRRFVYGEHRNDHQMATAKKFEDFPGIYAAYTEKELVGFMDKLSTSELETSSQFSPFAPDEFIQRLKDITFER